MVREEIAKYVWTFLGNKPSNWDVALSTADRILAIEGLCIKSDDQDSDADEKHNWVRVIK